MEREEILKKVVALVKEKLPVKGVEVRETTLFQEDLNADSIDFQEIVGGLEAIFNIEIPDEDLDADKIKTIKDAVDLICSKLK